jgi:membrane protein implicated in regulation of membrane protease activity
MEEAAMAQHRAPSKHVGTWIVITVLLAAALIGTLWVPFYNHLTPALWGFPFFYWYQLMWVPIVAILAAVAYLLSRRAQRGNGNAANDQILYEDEQEANVR